MNHMLMIYNQWGPNAVAGVWLHELYHVEQFSAGELDHLETDVDVKNVELAADSAAGCGLALLGRSDYQLRKYLADYYVPSSTHGSLAQRISAVSNGHEKCSRN